MNNSANSNRDNNSMSNNGSRLPDTDSAPHKPMPKKNAKDSVFCDLFSDPKYLLQLYGTMHPEDVNVKESEIGIVTLKNVLLDQLYNDLGFTVGDKLLILVEAQSTWTMNIIIRSLMYLAQTWKERLESTGQSLYGSKRVELPTPELYVIYSGDQKSRKRWITLSKEFFPGKKSAIEVKVKVLYGDKKGDIVYQYVTFTKVYNEQVKKWGRTQKAVLETIRICKDRDILREYLENREKEVVDIMMTLFDDDYILETYIESERKEAAKEAEERAAKAEEAKEKAETAVKKAAHTFWSMGLSVEQISQTVGESEEVIKKWLEESEMLAK